MDLLYLEVVGDPEPEVAQDQERDDLSPGLRVLIVGAINRSRGYFRFDIQKKIYRKQRI